RSYDSQASDNRARDNAAASDKAASDKAARNDSSDRDAAAKARDDGRADAKADAKADTARVARSKSEAPRSGKPDEPKQVPSGDDAAAKDQVETTQDGTAVVTADVVAIANPAAAAAAPAAPVAD